MTIRQRPRLLSVQAAFAALGFCLACVRPVPAAESAAKGSDWFGGWDLPEFIDRLPDLLADRLPGFEPSGVVRLYVRPHFGDFIHRDYVRVPLGARVKVSENVECSTELQSYFTHGLSDAAGYGLSGVRIGAKCEHLLPSLGHGGLSVGLSYQSPLSRPPLDLTDGYRHVLPYVAATRPIVPEWRLLGYASVSADFLSRTALPDHFARNQLHANSLTFSAGAAREFRRFHASLTANVTTSALTSDEGKQVYSLRPEIVVPWKARADARAQVLFTLGARAVHGPDGDEFGLSGSMRVEFQLGRHGKQSGR